MMATREVLPTAAIYSVGSMVFTTSIVLLRRSTALTLPMVWRTFVFYQVKRGQKTFDSTFSVFFVFAFISCTKLLTSLAHPSAICIF